MKKLNILLLACLVMIHGIAMAKVVTITDEDFEGGASGWSTNTTDNTHPGTFTGYEEFQLGKHVRSGMSQPMALAWRRKKYCRQPAS